MDKYSFKFLTISFYIINQPQHRRIYCITEIRRRATAMSGKYAQELIITKFFEYFRG